MCLMLAPFTEETIMTTQKRSNPLGWEGKNGDVSTHFHGIRKLIGIATTLDDQGATAGDMTALLYAIGLHVDEVERVLDAGIQGDGS